MHTEASILVVDDLDANLIAMEAVLETIGRPVVTARSGEEALMRLLEREFAVILLDVQMGGMDGFETAELIRQRDKSKHTPIIFVTAINKADVHVFRGYSLGAVDYIFKPIVQEILQAKVRVFVDLFELRHREREIADALRLRTEELERTNAELAQFAHVAAHDMQEPLRTVSRYLKLLSKRFKGSLDPRASEFVDFALKGSDELLRLIQDLLAYARLGSQPVEKDIVNGEAILDLAVGGLRQAIEETGAVVTHDPLPELLGNEGQLVRVFRNLISNAIKFRSTAPPAIHVTAEPQGDSWLIQVRDNGIGIAVADRERMFRLFERLHSRHEYPGTGAGLAICKRIIEDHEGQIWLSGNPAGGSTVSFTLPSASRKQTPPAPSPTATA